jgi:NAD(P)H-dependent flavin oxidoreductase YrpB (nitropropane dioxygenase family)
MGVAVSSWRLAQAVARRGHLGVVSGTAIERVIACRLQEGDSGGHLRRVLARCPLPNLGARVLARWFRPEGLAVPGSYQPLPMFSLQSPVELLELTIAAAYAEVALAKEEGGQVGINLLEKIQLPTLPVLYGAMLAGVDWVLMGAGIPRDVPAQLDQLAAGQPAVLRLAVEGGASIPVPFEPAAFGEPNVALRRPRFLAIVSSDILASSLARAGGVAGFVVEDPTAGGHNAPPRGGGSLDARGEPVYGPRDRPDLARLRALGLPFWLAGGKATAEALALAREVGAQGVQVGTAFAFCAESGLRPDLRVAVLDAVQSGTAELFTDPKASPTGFPFKLVRLPGTEGGRAAEERQRRPCSLGYLRQAYAQPSGGVGWRCAAEPTAQFASKGGSIAGCAGRRCLCNGLMAAAGHAYATQRGGELELPLLTAGDDLQHLGRFVRPDRAYSADDVLNDLLSPLLP